MRRKDAILFGIVAILLASSSGLANMTQQSGYIVAWGYDYWGQVSEKPGGDNFVCVAGGHDWSMALRSTGEIVVWGGSQVVLKDDRPTESNFERIAAGAFHALALRSDGSIKAWGWDNHGQGESGVPGGNDFVEISAGMFHSLALRSDGSLVSWGDDSYDQRSDMPTYSDFIDIACGNNHCVALRSDGTLIAWGDDGDNQVSGVPSGDDWVEVGAGAYHSTARRSDGTVFSWGGTGWNQTDISGLENAIFEAIAVNGSHNLGLRADGTIGGWGRNDNGQLIPPDLHYIAIGAGHDHSLGIAIPTIDALVDIDPDTLNLNSKGNWITAYILLPEGYNVEDIDPATVKLGDGGFEVGGEYGEFDSNIAMVKFLRSTVQDNLEPGEVELTVTGQLSDGTLFEGADMIRVIDEGGKKQ